jgi:hypothetical protein
MKIDITHTYTKTNKITILEFIEEYYQTQKLKITILEFIELKYYQRKGLKFWLLASVGSLHGLAGANGSQ